jgi:hypothetical protein
VTQASATNQTMNPQAVTRSRAPAQGVWFSMPWIATLESAVKPRMMIRLAIENHRNHPQVAGPRNTIAALMRMPHTALHAASNRRRWFEPS